MVGTIGTVRACVTVIGKRGALNPNTRSLFVRIMSGVCTNRTGGYREVWPSRGL